MADQAYRVASLLPEHARRAAVEAEYRWYRSEHFVGGVKRARGGCCPLGVALQTLDPSAAGCPPPNEFARAAVDLGLCDPREGTYASDVAGEFIDDFDCGRITDLAAALDVTPLQAPPGSALADEQGPAPRSARAQRDGPINARPPSPS
jgi:hypothetical protein